MKISCCIFDLDGTLLTSKKHISDTDRKTLKALSETGVKIIIATGRSVHQVKEYIEELGISAPIITFNGALISNPTTGEIIMKKTFPEKAVRSLEKILKDDGLNYFFYTSNRIYYARDCDYSEYQKYYNTTLPDHQKIPLYHISEISEAEYNDVLVIALNNDPGVLPELKTKVKGAENFSFLDSGSNVIDILPRGTAKGEAIKKLASHFAISLSETVAFGDSQNDETMFEAAGFSVAMGNAYSSLKEKADFITKTNDECGITHALKILLDR
ncbi:MAG: HAD family phosphatase [Oscillospiraceae bacterium]|nr:HAD family phosphatase [Oscillospiraceae bacterium]